MANEQEQFQNLIQNLMSPDNDVRTQAEEAYEGIPAVSKVPFLIQMMRNVNAPLEGRTMAAVMLRRLFVSSFEEFWPQVPAEMQAQIKEQMLVCIQQETNMAIKKKMCECTAEFARNMLDDDGNNTWPEILKFLFECASSTDVTQKESSLHIFSVVPGIFGAQQNQYVDVIKQMLHQSLADQANLSVREAAVKATVAFVLANEKEVAVLNHLKDLLPGVIQGIVQSVEKQDDDALLKCLIDLAENTPKYLRPQAENVINLCMKILGNSEVADNWRQLALEVITTLAETAPGMFRKMGGKFLNTLVPQILTMMVELEDEDDWSTQDEIEDEDNDSNAIAGESALDRLACALGGKTMLPNILQNIPPMLQNPDWKYRHAALMAISACGEGCHKQMEEMLTGIVDAIIPFLQDQHPRVRYATCNALGQMCTDFGPTFQKKFHEKVVAGLLTVMDDYGNPRVQAHAGAALVNFSEDCPKSILSPYLDPIILKLEQVLNTKFKECMQTGNKLVLEQCVITLASVADTSEDKFIEYYDRFMPSLKFIVQNALAPELRLLRGKTIECISLIGLAVGKDKFMQDCSDIMQLLLKTQTDWDDTPEDDPQISYMISAWARMCKIMGKEFEQYLPLVMGPVLKAADIKPEVAIMDSEEMKTMENDTDWQFVTLGDQQSFGIRTSGLEEKATACQMLVCYARELKEGFAEFTEQVVKIMVSHLKFYFHDGVRIAASESLPYLLDCAKIRGPEYLQGMWQYICQPLLQAVESEPDGDIRAEHMSSLAQCIERMGAGCLTEEQLKELVQVLDTLIAQHFAKHAERQEKRKDEDYDEVVEEDLLDEDDEDTFVLSKISDIMHAIFGTHKVAALPVFEQLLPHFTKLLAPDRPWSDRQWSMCIFDDLIEHASPQSFNYQQHFLHTIIQCICDKQPELRQAAAYGVGVMGMFGGPPYVPAMQEAVPMLIKMIQDPESRDVEKIHPTENAIAAITKICKYCPQAVNLDDVLPHWFSWLPVWEDEDEAVHIYNYMCDLVEGNHPAILGENNQNLPRIVAIIAEAFRKECIDKESDVYVRMKNILVQIQSGGDLFQACVQQLDEKQQAALSKALS